ncbi:DUF7342 family protein [Haloferax larsenii]|uniref:ArsR family transcriptional regulator n=1 Tax=Haloferax larsenii TaxID=302484 RepID=A0A1H7TWT9_HALLR|nr:hypothetical protein [Haloferax larsenii]SEL89004.1 hypothetical protein SAMN04488691_11084 [Haloferax larsenii]
MNLAGEWDKAVESRTVKDRVYEAATTLTSPTTVADVAERADCTKEGARPHLEWFVEVGVLEKVADNPALFVRNEAYFEFRRITELARELNTPEAAEEAIDEYRTRERELSSYFAESSPEAVVLSEATYEDLDEAYDRLSEWRTITCRLRELREAKFRLESNHGGSPASSFP